MDFTIDKYRALCSGVMEHGYAPCTVVAWLANQTRTTRSLILRHDVDKSAADALRMAEIEADLGIASTYYFRFNPRVFQPEVISRVAALGHEVGYHYEVLDKAKGNHRAAIALFKRELRAFRHVVPVHTIAMHGNPLTKWDNRDLWKTHTFEEFGLLGEAYLSVRGVAYLSDAGRTWSPRNKTKDWMPSTDGGRMPQPDVNSTDDVIRWLGENACTLYMTAHPARWTESSARWLMMLARDGLANVAKHVLRAARTGANAGSVLDSGADSLEGNSRR